MTTTNETVGETPAPAPPGYKEQNEVKPLERVETPTKHVEGPIIGDEKPAKDALSDDRDFQPPEIIRYLSAEQRATLEKRLRRKIDLRLLPMIVVMYILNYIDRSVPTSPCCDIGLHDQKQHCCC